MSKSKSKSTETPTEPQLYSAVSRLNHPVTLSYNGEALIVPPFGQINNILVEKLGPTPKGITTFESKRQGG
jgi:hypothetical protein